MKSGNYLEAFAKLRSLAILGDGNAQYLIGQMYAVGWGRPKNDEAAMEWFRKAARWPWQESERAASAAFYVGKDYEEGIGAVPRDPMEAVKWYRIAAEGGHRQAAELLGKAYEEGLLGLPRDPAQVEYWRRKAK
ncbi:MAG: hypothetical protein A2Y74_07725 [Actinobacteria bacterium RBG_13_63_9]|nr:MAG: hypothetical protein A2Y74_07725 [Actinobacteria bacterium RBG_13_63_9]